jgi:hypothetical protein
MRQQQALQQDAETHASGEGAHWRAVYTVGPCVVSAGHVRTIKDIVGETRAVGSITSSPKARTLARTLVTVRLLQLAISAISLSRSELDRIMLHIFYN